MRAIFRLGTIALVLFSLLVFWNNTSYLVAPAQSRGTLVAHRGVHQTFTSDGLTNESCTATMIFPPEHEFIENTIASIGEAFRLGADVVEIDIHPTTDGQFAVFHDWTLDCRTDGTGVTRERSMAYLKTLDLGYGYTADGGMTFPLRGKGIGLMPALDEVFEAFPGRHFSVNLKSDDIAEGELLVGRLSRMSEDQRALLTFWVPGDTLYAMLRDEFPTLPLLNGKAARDCLKRYALWGWMGFVPSDCRLNGLVIPLDYAPYLWGYPERLRARMNEAGAEVVLLPSYREGVFDTTFDDPAELDGIPFGYGIWTDKIEIVGPAWRGGG